MRKLLQRKLILIMSLVLLNEKQQGTMLAETVLSLSANVVQNRQHFVIIMLCVTPMNHVTVLIVMIGWIIVVSILLGNR